MGITLSPYKFDLKLMDKAVLPTSEKQLKQNLLITFPKHLLSLQYADAILSIASEERGKIALYISAW